MTFNHISSVNVIKGMTKINFDTGLKQLLTDNSVLKKSQANLLSFRANLEKAKGLYYPTIDIISFVAPVFEVRGDALSVQRNYKNWGPYINGQVTVLWPIFTFGAISSANKAARNGFIATEYYEKSNLNATIFEYKKLYLSAILLTNLKKIYDEATTKIKEIYSKAFESYISGEGKVVKKDIARIKLYQFELQKIGAQLQANTNSVALALGHYTGKKTPLWAVDEKFPDLSISKIKLNEFVKLTFDRNPLWKALSYGLTARKELIKVSKKSNYPVIFLGLRGEANYTNVRTDVDSSYANDPFNRNTAAVALGAKWQFNWGKFKSKNTKAVANYEKLLAQKKEAKTGLPLKVSLAFFKVQEEEKKNHLSIKSLKEAARWSVTELSAFKAGIGDTKDLVESVGAYYLKKFEVARSRYSVCLVWAKLAKEVGDETKLRSWKLK